METTTQAIVTTASGTVVTSGTPIINFVRDLVLDLHDKYVHMDMFKIMGVHINFWEIIISIFIAGSIINLVVAYDDDATED